MDPQHLENLTKAAQAQGGNVFRVASATPSMLGNPYAGNAVVVIPQAEYKVGDDVLFPHIDGKRNILHRITHVKDGKVYTKGTFNSMGDGWTPVDKLKGKVTEVIRLKGEKK